MKVDYYLIRDIKLAGDAASDEEIAANPKLREEVRRNRYSITSLCVGDNGTLFCGVTNTGGDILHAFDLKTCKFRCLNFAAIAEKPDHKIHKGLWLDRGRNSLYFGIASLESTADLCTGPGGRLMRYDIGKEKYEEIGRPSPGSYIQATSYDAKRRLMTAFTLPGLGFAVMEIDTGKVRWDVPLESIVHIPAVDRRGGVWGTWGIGRQGFFRYDPDKNSFEFSAKCVMPTANEASNIMYAGAGPVDCMICGPDGMIYVASALAEVYRINPDTMELSYLARPLPFNRLPGIVFGPDGRLYGVGGDAWQTSLFALDVASGATEILGKLHHADGRRCFRPHDLAYADGRFFVGETDNPKQSGALWACTL
ncbi:MAG: hypothetical protein BIFFINMI_03850 [Phycisphaerae bacterium]|nr:hypothetical protein [Phycisphaerae bacterium]